MLRIATAATLRYRHQITGGVGSNAVHVCMCAHTVSDSGNRVNLCVRGLLSSQAACYLCPVEGCEGSQGFKYVRIHVPGAVERSLVSAHFTCEICGERLREDQSRRRLSGVSNSVHYAHETIEISFHERHIFQPREFCTPASTVGLGTL